MNVFFLCLVLDSSHVFVPTNHHAVLSRVRMDVSEGKGDSGKYNNEALNGSNLT